MNFASIDVESANYADASICSIGVALFADGKLAESNYWMVKPPKGAGWFKDHLSTSTALLM
jgi:DNA polymerase-3 subunit epsilon